MKTLICLGLSRSASRSSGLRANSNRRESDRRRHRVQARQDQQVAHAQQLEIGEVARRRSSLATTCLSPGFAGVAGSRR